MLLIEFYLFDHQFLISYPILKIEKLKFNFFCQTLISYFKLNLGELQSGQGRLLSVQCQLSAGSFEIAIDFFSTM